MPEKDRIEKITSILNIIDEITNYGEIPEESRPDIFYALMKVVKKLLKEEKRCKNGQSQKQN